MAGYTICVILSERSESKNPFLFWGIRILRLRATPFAQDNKDLWAPSPQGEGFFTHLLSNKISKMSIGKMQEKARRDCSLRAEFLGDYPDYISR